VLIGELSRRSGVSVRAIRFYERRGVLPAASRTHAGYRQYAESDVECLRAVRQAQELGFTLREIEAFLVLHPFSTWHSDDGSGRTGTHSCMEAVIAATKGNLARLDDEIRSMQEKRARLAKELERFKA
jgi:DNA-binding transcriptional MerR regulator